MQTPGLSKAVFITHPLPVFEALSVQTAPEYVSLGNARDKY